MLEEIGAEALACLVEEVEEFGIERLGAIGPDEVALAGLEAGGALGKTVDEAVDGAGDDVFVGEQVPKLGG